MTKIIEGEFNAQGLKAALIVSRFNSFITDRLIEGAVDVLTRHGMKDDEITEIKVPGAFEIPLALKRIAGKNDYDLILCLGAVIRGGTPHFDYICAEMTKGIASIAMDTGKPIGFGVLTCDTVDQAIERAGTKAGNKGSEAAMAAIEMARLIPKL